MIKTLFTQARKRAGLTSFVLSFVFFAFLMCCAPYASDDLEFGSLPYTQLSQFLRYALEYGNGRLLGNLTAIALSSIPWLNVLVKAAVLAGTVALLPTVLGLTQPRHYLLSFLLTVTVEPVVFGEVYVWTSGFSNYMPPIFLSLVILYAIRRYPELSSPLAKAAVFLGVFLMGVASQLFIEHSSGVNLLLALCLTVLHLKQRRKQTAALSIVWLIAAAIGFALMLLIPRLFYIADNHTETYRSLHLNSLFALILSCAKNVIQLSNHYFGACTLPLCFGAVTTVWLTRSKRSEKANTALYSLGGVSVIYLVLSLTLGLADYLGKAAIVQHVLTGFFAFLPFAVWVLAALKLEGALRVKMLLCLGFALVSLLPLLVVTPIPTRVIYQSWIFAAMGGMLCFRELEGCFGEKFIRAFAKAATAACLLSALLLGSVFVSIAHMARIRDRHIRQEIEKGATTVQVFSLPYRYTTWDHLWSLRYLYPSDQEVQFSAMDFDNWMNDVYE